jgi:hypothetical protein
LKSRVGETSAEYSEKVDEARLQAFRAAVGATGPGVPPTFMTCFRAGEFELFNTLGFELSQVLHAEQEFTYENDLQAGDTAFFKATLTNVLEKISSSGGALRFLSFVSTIEAQRDGTRVKIGSSKTTVVVRGQA